MSDAELNALLAKAWQEGQEHESDYLSTWGQFCPHVPQCNPYIKKEK